MTTKAALLIILTSLVLSAGEFQGFQVSNIEGKALSKPEGLRLDEECKTSFSTDFPADFSFECTFNLTPLTEDDSGFSLTGAELEFGSWGAKWEFNSFVLELRERMVSLYFWEEWGSKDPLKDITIPALPAGVDLRLKLLKQGRKIIVYINNNFITDWQFEETGQLNRLVCSLWNTRILIKKISIIPL